MNINQSIDKYMQKLIDIRKELNIQNIDDIDDYLENKIRIIYMYNHTIKHIYKIQDILNDINSNGKDITIILGASTHENHIQDYIQNNPDEYVIGFDSINIDWGMRDPKLYDNKTTLNLDFNVLDDLKKLIPLKNKINKIVFDWSTQKYMKHWKNDHYEIIYELLKKGGKLYLEGYLSEYHEIFKDIGFSISGHNQNYPIIRVLSNYGNEDWKPHYVVGTK